MGACNKRSSKSKANKQERERDGKPGCGREFAKMGIGI